MHIIEKVAHRGGSLLAPENTLAAFQRGIDEKADAIELDVHLSKDGEIVVMHDPSLYRTTGKEGYISDLSLEEIKSLDARLDYRGEPSYDEQTVPTLSEVLDLIQKEERRVALQIEIKVDQHGNRYKGIEEAVISTLRTYNMIERTTIISFDFETLLTVKAMESSIKCTALVSRKFLEQIGMRGPEAVADAIADLGVEVVGINYTYLSDKLFEAFTKRGLAIGAWTVNDEKDILRIASMGVNFITSDRPDLLRELL